MTLKLKVLSSFLLALLLLVLYFGIFTPEIKRFSVSKPISLKELLAKDSL